MIKQCCMIIILVLFTGCGSEKANKAVGSQNGNEKVIYMDESALQGDIRECVKIINLHIKNQNEHNNAANDKILTQIYINRAGHSHYTASDYKIFGAVKLKSIGKNKDGSYTAFVTEKTNLEGANGEEMDSMYVLKKEDGKWFIDATD